MGIITYIMNKGTKLYKKGRAPTWAQDLSTLNQTVEKKAVVHVIESDHSSIEEVHSDVSTSFDDRDHDGDGLDDPVIGEDTEPEEVPVFETMDERLGVVKENKRKRY